MVGKSLSGSGLMAFGQAFKSRGQSVLLFLTCVAMCTLLALEDDQQSLAWFWPDTAAERLAGIGSVEDQHIDLDVGSLQTDVQKAQCICLDKA